MRPQRTPPRSRDPENTKRLWTGIGAGMIPVLLAWIALGIGVNATGTAVTVSSILGIIAAIAYAAEIIAMIVCMVVDRWRYYGYGLLTMIFVGPVVWSIGCVVILSVHK